MNWKEAPLLRVLLPFVAGIIAAILTDSAFHIHYSFIISLTFAVCILLIFHKRIFRNYSQRWISALLINILVFVLAYANTGRMDSKNRADAFSRLRSMNDTLIATVDEPVNERENTCRLILAIDYLKRNKQWIACRSEAIAYVEKDSLSKTLRYGDRLIISGGFTDVNPPQNPGEFDYRHYLAMRSIYSQGYVKTGNWRLLQHDEGNFLISLSLSIREKFLKIFESNNITGEEYAVAGAMILGYRDKVDADLIATYQGAGVMHLLCVAGMHVGIVFLVLNFILFFLRPL